MENAIKQAASKNSGRRFWIVFLSLWTVCTLGIDVSFVFGRFPQGNGLGTWLFHILLLVPFNMMIAGAAFVLATARGTRLVPVHWYLASIVTCFFLIVVPVIPVVLIGFVYSEALGPPPALMIGISSTLMVCAVALFVGIGCRLKPQQPPESGR